MRILVTFALENEFGPWRAMRKFRRGFWGRTDVQLAEIGGSEVGVILTGVGPRQIARRLSEVMRNETDGLSVCICSGVAGALKPEFGIGQVLAAKAVVSENAAQLSRGLRESSRALISFAGDCGATVVDRFYTSARVITTSEEKQALSEMAEAVDMESFEVLHGAASSGIPAVAIRAISDAAGEDLPLDLNRVFTGTGAVSVPRVLGQVTLHPGAVPGLVRLGQQTKRATEALAEFLDRYVATLAERARNLEVKAAAI
jgi:adenosylhomocysteine nucleosidase